MHNGEPFLSYIFSDHTLLISVIYQARKRNTNNIIFSGEYILTY